MQGELNNTLEPQVQDLSVDHFPEQVELLKEADPQLKQIINRLLYQNLMQQNRIDDYVKKEQAIKTAIKQMGETLGFTGRETSSEMIGKIMGKIPGFLMEKQVNPAKFAAKFSFINELMEVIKADLTE